MPFIERITDFMNNDEENLEDYDNSYNILRYNINYETEWLQNDYLMNNEVAITIKSVSEKINGFSYYAFIKLLNIKIIT